jgi:tetratricopeptide (TPR) repeat protein
MAQPERPVDKMGFPIPSTFEAPAKARRPNAGAAVWIIRTLLVLIGLGLMVGMAFKGIGPDQIASWYLQRADDCYRRDDVRGALTYLDRAISWTPGEAELYHLRARCRRETHDLAGSLEDYNRLIELSPNRADAFTGRSTVYQRMERHREAIDDATRALELRPNNHSLLNNRAYVRAIGNLELEEALADIQQAIDQISYEEPAYLDTRGYIYYLLDRQEDALKDLDRAVQLASLHRKRMLQAAGAQRVRSRQRARLERELNEHEAVLVYHRGLVHEKLGNTDQANTDLARGRELGYNPAEGVY